MTTNIDFSLVTATPTDLWGTLPNGGVTTGTISAASTTQSQPHEPVWSPESPAFYFEDQQHQEMFRVYRKQRQAHNSLSRPGPAWTEEDELKLVDALWMDWIGEHYPASTSWTYDALDLDALVVTPLRRHELKAFKIDYETYAEIKLRLLNTIIAVKGHPFLVQKIAQTPQGFKLAVSNGTKTFAVMYNDLTDLRSLPPMYVNSPSYPGWLCRRPGRVYQQGMNRSNTQLLSIDGKAAVSNLDATYFVKTFHKRQTRAWDTTLHSLLEGGEIGSIRLSDDVAVKNDKGKILACYRGRFLGKIKDADVLVGDEDDLLQQWIERSVKEVGLELRA